ncbi:hypothetical protein C8J57DRAFT_1460179 [Mycena rebaudengoi]|nr:hypothetical protein C8J57DRAFT_1460179 [Mycena rebaudengoi]
MMQLKTRVNPGYLVSTSHEKPKRWWLSNMVSAQRAYLALSVPQTPAPTFPGSVFEQKIPAPSLGKNTRCPEATNRSRAVQTMSPSQAITTLLPSNGYGLLWRKLLVHSWPPKDSLAQLNAVFSSGWTSQLGMLDTAGHSLLLFNVPDSSPHLALTESESEFGRSYISAVDSAQATPPLILPATTDISGWLLDLTLALNRRWSLHELVDTVTAAQLLCLPGRQNILLPSTGFSSGLISGGGTLL